MVVKMLLGHQHLIFEFLAPLLIKFPANVHPRRQQMMTQDLDPCHLHEKPSVNSRFLIGPAQAIAGHLGIEPADI